MILDMRDLLNNTNPEENKYSIILLVPEWSILSLNYIFYLIILIKIYSWIFPTFN